jgi:hypothetical protein
MLCIASLVGPVRAGVDEVSVVTSKGAGLYGDRRPFPSAVMLY